MSRERDRAPLIPDFLWPWIIPLLILLAAIAGGLSIVMTDKIGPRSFEQRMMDALWDSGISDDVFRFGLEFGSPRFFAAIVVALAVWAAVKRSPTALLACLAVPAAVVLVEEVLKPLVNRSWALPDTEPTYPSGTAAGVAAWTTLAWLLAMPAVRSGGWRVVLTIALGLITALTAVAVVGDHRHFPLDALGGVAAGASFVLLWAAAIDVVTGAHRARAPDAAPARDDAVVSRD